MGFWASYMFERRQKGGFVKGWFGECALVPVFVLGEHANVASFRFSFRGNIRMYPRSGFRSGGTSAKITPSENHPFANPRHMTEKWGFICPYVCGSYAMLSVKASVFCRRAKGFLCHTAPCCMTIFFLLGGGGNRFTSMGVWGCQIVSCMHSSRDHMCSHLSE